MRASAVDGLIFLSPSLVLRPGNGEPPGALQHPGRPSYLYGLCGPPGNHPAVWRKKYNQLRVLLILIDLQPSAAG